MAFETAALFTDADSLAIYETDFFGRTEIAEFNVLARDSLAIW